MLKQDFIQRMRRLLRDEYNIFEGALGDAPPVSIRINPLKFDVCHLQQWVLCTGNERSTDTDSKRLTGTGNERSTGADNERSTDADNKQSTANISELERVPWCETGYYLPQRPSFTFDPLFHAGAYYVQEASSMFVEQAVLQICAAPDLAGRPVTALDLCAAPGGKSTHLSALLPAGSLLVSNEVVRSRSLILAENMAKWGSLDTIITRNDPKTFGNMPHLFDVVVADLPCSGEGMFRKIPASRDEWSIDHVRLCAARQRRIIHDVWDALRPGGYLIYSTCTFNTEENEENVKILSEELEAEIIPVPTRPEWNIAGSICHDMPVYRFFPHRTRGEGFFLALLQKPARRYATLGVADITGEDAQQQACFAQQRARHDKQQHRRHAQQQARHDKQQQSGHAQQQQGRHAVKAAVTPAASMLSNPEKFTYLTAGIVQALPKVHESSYAIVSAHLNIIAAGISIGEYKGRDFTPSAALALSTEIDAGTFPRVELAYEQAIAYLQRQTIVMPPNTSKGYVIVTYKETPLGFAKNIGYRANNCYPKEWRIVSNNH